MSIVKGVLVRGWEPFTAPARLGEMDVAFLSVYALSMYAAGHLADRLHVGVFLTLGMLGSACFVGLFGMGFWLDIHSVWFYLGVQMAQGAFQATGWPCVVAIVSNWFGKRKRGLLMGLWNAHTSLGNICGSLLAARLLRYGWGFSFLLPALLLASAALFVHLFLLASPRDAGLHLYTQTNPHPLSIQLTSLNGGEDVNGNHAHAHAEAEAEEKRLLGASTSDALDGDGDSTSAVGFIQAWKIPGVASYALCLFFSKLVAYTFLYWLPFYIKHTAIAGKDVSDNTAGKLSTLFDVGGLLGGVLAGHISDRLEARAITAVVFLYSAIPVLIVYRIYGSISMYINISLMMAAGFFVNGPYSLITTAVSADLGTHSSLNGNSRALATVTAIIDGTGSVGAALGPLLTGYISATGWNGVFIMLILATVFAGLLLMHLMVAEIKEKIHNGNTLTRKTPNHEIAER